MPTDTNVHKKNKKKNKDLITADQLPTPKKNIINQLFAIIKVSFENIVYFLLSFGANLKKIYVEKNTMIIKKLKMKRPLDGSLAKV